VLNFFAFAAVLGKVKDFLGVISEDNERLQLGAKVVLFGSFTQAVLFYWMPICLSFFGLYF
jgi:hypothetical protein